VKAYLGDTTKNHPPQNHKNVGFILINERKNSKKNYQSFYDWLSRTITFDFPSPKHLQSKSMQDVFLFLLHSIDLVSQLQTCLQIVTNFVNGILFLLCI
jgi:hypothetical protein